MKVVLAVASVALSICTTTGCAPHGGLYRVSDSAAAFTPPTVPTATVKVIRPLTFLSSPGISVIFDNGETFKGSLIETLVASANKKIQYSQSSSPPHPNLADVWDALYGSQYFLSHYGKANPGKDNYFYQAILTGNRGTILQFEMGLEKYCTPNSAGSKDPFGETCESNLDGTGVASDNKGSIYKYLDHHLVTTHK
jgi:hypothetical protein